MRFLYVMVALLLVAVFAVPVMAQATTLEYGQEVSGEITDSAFEVEYTFSGEEGQLISIMMAPADQSQLDPEIYLYDADNTLLAANDDFAFPTALIVLTLPATGEYTLIATRNDGRSGATSGDYTLMVGLAEPVQMGSTLDITYSTDFFVQTDNVFLLAPEQDGTMNISYAQEAVDVYGSLRIAAVPDFSVDPEFSFYEDVLWFGNTAISESGSISIEVTGGRLYILRVEFGGYTPNSSFTAQEGTMTVTLE